MLAGDCPLDSFESLAVFHLRTGFVGVVVEGQGRKLGREPGELLVMAGHDYLAFLRKVSAILQFVSGVRRV